jgi:hypothetical protein
LITNTTGSGNVGIGASADVSAINAKNRIAIGNGATATIDNGFFTITGLAKLGAGAFLRYDTGTGQIGPDPSSLRYKENVEDAPDMTGHLDNIKIRKYTLKAPLTSTMGYEIGIIAEELYEHLPEFVPLDGEGLPVAVNYDRLSLISIQELQKMRARFSELEKSHNSLKEQFVDLYNKVYQI